VLEYGAAKQAKAARYVGDAGLKKNLEKKKSQDVSD
jgi:hypothetical protein